MSRLIDISPLLSPRIGVWPGDKAFEQHVALSVDGGDNITLSAIHTTVHLGAHTDAPNHYAPQSEGIAARPLDYYYGLAQVMHVEIGPGERIGPHHLTGRIEAPRLLFSTGTFPDPEHFNTDFASLSAELVEVLHTEGVRLVGIDTPSIDLFDDKELESHQAVARSDMAILEGIVLQVPDGLYTLIALPLKIEGADASPVRAVLIEG